LKGGIGEAQPIRFTQDGSLFYATHGSATDIYVAGIDPTTGKLTSEPKRINQRVGNSGGVVHWLPDGESLSFRNAKPEPPALVEHALATGEEREIWGGKTGRPFSGYLGWFSDGSIMAQRGGRRFERVDSRTGQVKQSWTAPSAQSTSGIGVPSPDLMTVYFTRKDETVPCEDPSKCTFVVAAREIQTGRDREIFRVKAMGVRGQSISPDGRQIAFILVDPRSHLMVAPTGGGTPRELYSSDRRLHSTTWTHDGGHVLAFTFGYKSGSEAWTFPIGGGPLEKSPIRVSADTPESPAISPDGTQIAFAGGNDKSEIWVMSGLFPGIKPAKGR
jgi:hypothetical protein